MKKFFTIFTVVVALSLGFSYADAGRQAYMEKSPGTFDAAAYVQSMQVQFNWLLSEAVPLTGKALISINVTKEDMKGVDEYKCESCSGLSPKAQRVRIGLVKNIDFNFADAPSRPTADGGMVWTAAVESKTAAALRLHFTNFNLPSNMALYIYNIDGEAFGPYTGRGPGAAGDFWSHTLMGPIAYVQLRQNGPASLTNAQEINFKISGVGHLGEKFLLPFYQQRKAIENLDPTLTHCPENADCVEDASCYSGTAINNAKYAVAHMEWVSGAWLYYCSGGLVADTVAGSQIPYFLTANHCISRTRDAAGLECYFQYWTASCHGACYDPVGAVPRTLGAAVISTNKTGDYTLMQLSENPPAGSYFMGWTSTPIANTNGVEIFRISHPSGSPQAYTKQVVDTSAGTCSSWPRGSWIYSRDVIGATEGGSSGSPVYNLSGQIVGQLSGACGYNVNDPCDAVNNATVDGAFASYYNTVKQWLDPAGGGGTMHVQSIVLRKTVKGSFSTAYADVTIVDDGGAPVSSAAVTGTFSGDVAGTKSASTNTSGVATLSIKISGTINTFTFCVDNVTHTSFTYNASANVETCDTY